MTARSTATPRALRLRLDRRLRHHRTRCYYLALLTQRAVGNHFCRTRRPLHLAKPGADVGGEAGIGGHRREFRRLAVADLMPV